ncbi:MAG: hypothetical protein ABSA54_02145 [Terriglobales bacterium]
MKRQLQRLVRFGLVCLGVLLLVIAVEVLSGWRCDLQGQIPAPVPQPEHRKAAVAGIKDYSRPEDDAYLSYPEWYIVWSYQEKADFQENRLPSGFPYFGAVRQYWKGYCCISRLTRGKYEFNVGEQAMLVVIGASFSAEYTLKGLYENTIGRLSEWTSGHQFTDEDRYAYKVAREYADFVHVRPFYEFQFARHVKGLWAENSLWGPHPIRKWERRIFLTIDYTAEAFYCWFIEKGTHATYDREPSNTYAWVENLDETVLPDVPHLKLIKRVDAQACIVDIPRYHEFTAVASMLAQHGARFVEIAGNSQITFSVLAPQAWHYHGSVAQQLFPMQVLTCPGWQRVVLTCGVLSLAQSLSDLHSDGLLVEHVYDY